jgi:hypothetical protein
MKNRTKINKEELRLIGFKINESIDWWYLDLGSFLVQINLDSKKVILAGEFLQRGFYYMDELERLINNLKG